MAKITTTSNAALDLEPNGTGDINLTPGTNGDVIIPANKGLTFGNDGEIIEGDGTDLTVTSSNDLTLDATGDIILDADGADVTLKDDGTTYGSLKQSSGHLVIQPTSSKEIILNEFRPGFGPDVD